MTFFADGGEVVVAGKNERLIGKGQNFRADRFDKRRKIAARHVGAADGAAEEGIARKNGGRGILSRGFFRRVRRGGISRHDGRRQVEACASLGVAGAVKDVGFLAVELKDLRVADVFVRGRRLGRLDATRRPLPALLLKPRVVVSVNQKFCSGEAAVKSVFEAVVEVAVRIEDGENIAANALDPAFQGIDSPRRIHQNALAALIVRDDEDVVLKRADLLGVNLHIKLA